MIIEVLLCRIYSYQKFEHCELFWPLVELHEHCAFSGKDLSAIYWASHSIHPSERQGTPWADRARHPDLFFCLFVQVGISYSKSDKGEENYIQIFFSKHHSKCRL